MTQTYFPPNPYLACKTCGKRVTSIVGSAAPLVNQPCTHTTGTASVCPTWDVRLGCRCLTMLGHVSHADPLL